VPNLIFNKKYDIIKERIIFKREGYFGLPFLLSTGNIADTLFKKLMSFIKTSAFIKLLKGARSFIYM